MTKEEKNKCYKVMCEGIRCAREAQEVFKKKNPGQIQLMFAQNKLGYAEGINQALARSIEYDDPGMKELCSLI